MSGRPRVLLSDRERRAWLRLIRTDAIGPVTFRSLVNHFGGALAALEAAPELALRGGRPIRLATEADADGALAALERIGARLVALGETDYPEALRPLDDAPPLLAIAGDAACLARPCCGVVGSRNASVAGQKFAAMVSARLGEAGYTVVSGLARGIDAAAHGAAVATGTAAVFAGALDPIYPPEHDELAARIVAGGGAIVSEMPMGHVPRARDFPRRNRIISGVSLAVVVIEAAERSGSLITARFAAEQGRVVFAVPGSPLDPRAGGSNRLIRDGAQIVTSVDDILDGLAPMVGQSPVPDAMREDGPPESGPADADPSDRDRVLSALGPTPVSVDEIIRFTGVRPAVVQLILLELALARRLERHPGGGVSLV